MVKNFYLSHLIGNKVFSGDRKFLGKLQDLIAEVNGNKPKVIAAKVKLGRESRFINFSDFEISEENEHYSLSCKEVSDIDISKYNTIMLAHNVLDKQIVDIDGRKVVRVNDVGCVLMTSGDVFVAAVDIGIEGLLRRLGIAKTVRKFLKVFKRDIQSDLILWDDVQTIANPRMDIKLSTPYSKLSTLHPSDLADIIEDLDKRSQVAVFASLDEERGPDVLEELEPDAQIQVLESLPLEKAADVLEKMPPDEVADILDDMQEEQVEELLEEMEDEISEEVKDLMEYPENTVGSLMSTEVFYLDINLTVAQTIEELRRLKPDEETIYYLYITDENKKLKGIVSLWRLVISPPDTKLSEIMDKNVIYVKDSDELNYMINIISKYNLLSVPVIDEKEVFIGKVIVNDVVYELLKPKRRRF